MEVAHRERAARRDADVRDALAILIKGLDRRNHVVHMNKDCSYLIRCIPVGEDNHVYIYPYRRDCLDRHMKQAEKDIRFITLDGKEKFRVQDGDMVRIMTGAESHLDRMARYIDNCHAEIGGSFYHIREFAEWMERSGSQVIPMRSTLPDKCHCMGLSQ